MKVSIYLTQGKLLPPKRITVTKKNKYKIIFEGSGNAALVGPNNLKRRDRTPLDCGYYITFENGRMSRREFATKEECQAYVTSNGDVKGTAEELSSLKLCVMRDYNDIRRLW